jgi:uroporphyrinogen-III decarboxylase
MAATGIQGIECMDPPPLGNTTLQDAKARVGRKLFLKGNLDSVNVLLRCTPEELDAYVRQTLATGMPGGGFILSSACSVAPHVPPWVLERLVPLADTYGRYPAPQA